jgi:hypothetical protein
VGKGPEVNLERLTNHLSANNNPQWLSLEGVEGL